MVNAELEQLGLDLTEKPGCTEIRLPARLGLGHWLLLCLLTLPVVLLWLGFTTAVLKLPNNGIVLAIVVALVALCALYGVFLVARILRYGVRVTITPDRLTAQPHQARNLPGLSLFLNEVRLLESKRAIVVLSGNGKLRIGSGLKRAERHAVFEFLNGTIARYLQAGSDKVEPIALSEMTADRGGQLESDSLETRLFAACERLRPVDIGDVHIAPNIPEPVLLNAAERYLDLQDDEVLLAIVGVKNTGSARAGCALTTRRIYWPGKRRSAAFAGPSRSHSLELAALPATIEQRGMGTRIQLGPKDSLPTVASAPLRAALGSVLPALGSIARGEPLASEPSATELSRARWAWPRVVADNPRMRALHAQGREYDRRTRVASQPIVTPLVVAACFTVFGLMVAQGVPVEAPTAEQLYAWGANTGTAIAFEHQYWRLFTAMFLHIGAFHLIMNMFCLIMSGPVVERYFGHLGFAALYALAGVGGFLASTAAQPAIVSAGASGAIFGVYGGLLGYLAIRHRDVPFAMLKPMLVGAITFIAYNTYYSLRAEGIDIAAHFGGLVTGFVVGLFLTLISERDARLAWRPAPMLRRSMAVAVLAAALVLIGQKSIASARTRLLADPEVGPRIDAAPAFNEFYAAANPILQEFMRIGGEIDKLAEASDQKGSSDAATRDAVERLTIECKAISEKVAKIPARNSELQAIRAKLASAQEHQLQVLAAFDRFLKTGDAAQITGPGGVNAAAKAYVDDINQTAPLRDAYIKAHQLRIISK
jgi:rhomboid protease GluP